jgi:hypothetical protein
LGVEAALSRRSLEAQQLRLHHALESGDLAQKLGRGRLVELDQSDRRVARRIAAEMEGRDVDLALAEQCAEAAVPRMAPLYYGKVVDLSARSAAADQALPIRQQPIL